ncbi:MAG TPA: chlorite dismutase family protein [Longimicrobiales bacterium]|nr:chlorite dismutase family protein [Longimicrobiales bacterium]
MPRTLSHYALVAFTPEYWSLPPAERELMHRSWLGELRRAARTVDVYQVFPTEHGADLCVWCSVEAEAPEAAAAFFEAFARATNPHRRFLTLVEALWGYTRPSQYSRAQRSTQEIDPFAEERLRYLVIYPFVKTTEWYLKPREERQQMMNEHIRIGKQYPEISQLLLYSFGVQDQEFVVVYEMDDLRRFSELVADLRATAARLFTVRDTPLHTCIRYPAEETLALFR